MQPINDNMDDLFRRAAENYPLRGANGWESVQSQLGVPNEKITPLKYSRSKKIKVILSLLLFLFLSSAIIISLRLNPRQNEIVKLLNRPTSEKATVITGIGNENKTGKAPLPPSHFFKAAGAVNKQPIISNESVLSNKRISDEERINIIPASFFEGEFFKPNPLAVINAITLTPLKTPAEFQNISKNENLNEKFHAKRSHSFYLGLMAGRGLSKVGKMPVSTKGWDAGIIAGYKFDKRFSLETGISVSTKYYTSAGKSFNMDEIKSSMPADMSIEKLEGQTRLVEIPVKGFYNLYIKKQNKIFVSAGFSAFIIEREFNHYHTKQNGQEGMMTGLYKTKNIVFPATVDLGAGWQHPVSRTLDIRLEPYVQLPLKGIGVGQLPVKSVGIHVGVVRRF